MAMKLCSRTPDTLFSLIATMGCKAGSPEEAAAFGDIVLVAIPLKNHKSVLVAPLEGKIVLDANNYYPERDGHIDELDRDEITTCTPGAPSAEIQGRQGVQCDRGS